MFNTTHPLIQSPMAGVQGSALAIAVCKAGGVGSLPAAMLNGEQLQAELELIREATDRPYNVNFFCHQQAAPDPRAERHWLEQLRPYYEELKLDPTDVPPGASRSPFSEAALYLIKPFRPPVVSFHFGLPSAQLLAGVKDMGSMVISSATTVAEGLWLQAQGADAVIAQGLEAGGHRGMFLSDDLSTQIGTLALLPQLVSALNIPVIAAGGIADARGVRAALTLGASAVQVGTAFLLCDEVNTSEVHRAALCSEQAQHTAVTNVFTGRPARGIVNRIIREQGPLRSELPSFPAAATALAPLKRAAEANNSDDFSSLWAGQNTSACSAVPASTLVARLSEGFTDNRALGA